jgi:hypothetical protein
MGCPAPPLATPRTAEPVTKPRLSRLIPIH